MLDPLNAETQILTGTAGGVGYFFFAETCYPESYVTKQTYFTQHNLKHKAVMARFTKSKGTAGGGYFFFAETCDAVWVEFSTYEHLLIRNVERFRGGLVLKAHGLLCHSTLGSRVKTKKRNTAGGGFFFFALTCNTVWGVGFGVWGVGCGVWGVGCGVWGVGWGLLNLATNSKDTAGGGYFFLALTCDEGSHLRLIDFCTTQLWARG